jgi:glycyl-tRNA synthetase
MEEDMLELDCSVLTPHDVLKTSGHVDRFSDLMCKDLKTGDIYRVDHLVEAELEKRLEHDKLARSGAKTKEPIAPLADSVKAEIESILAQVSFLCLAAC